MSSVRGINDLYDVVEFGIRLGDKIADKAKIFEYVGLSPFLVKAAVGWENILPELKDIVEAETEEIKTRTKELGKELDLGDDVMYDDAGDAMAVAVHIKNIAERHAKARAAKG